MELDVSGPKPYSLSSLSVFTKLFEKQDNTQAKECRIYPTIHAM